MQFKKGIKRKKTQEDKNREKNNGKKGKQHEMCFIPNCFDCHNLLYFSRYFCSDLVIVLSMSFEFWFQIVKKD